MTPLLIDQDVKDAIAKVVAYAEANRITLPELEHVAEGRGAVGDDQRRAVIVPFGFRCVFSIEEQRPPLGWVKHLSVSVVVMPTGTPTVVMPTQDFTARHTFRHNFGRLPTQHALRLLMDEFGMKKPLQQCIVHLEEVKVNGAVNVIEPMGDIDEIRRNLAAADQEPPAHVG